LLFREFLFSALLGGKVLTKTQRPVLLVPL